MFTRDKVTLRPVDWPDREQMYLWHCDSDLEIASGWGPRRSPTTYDAKFQSFLQDPPDDMVVFAIEAESELVGRIELAQIDREHRNASVGFFIGAREMWGQGIGTQAVIILVDYAFNVENLERVYAHTYSFNQRSRLLRSIAFIVPSTCCTWTRRWSPTRSASESFDATTCTCRSTI